jgi:hypothetical protein
MALRKTLKYVLSLLACMFVTPAWATYSCIGTIQRVGLSPGTAIVVLSTTSGLSDIYLCSIETATSSANGTVTPEQCKTFLAMLLSAQASGAAVNLMFNDGLTCSTHPSWSWLTGWYYGPVILSP